MEDNLLVIFIWKGITKEQSNKSLVASTIPGGWTLVLTISIMLNNSNKQRTIRPACLPTASPPAMMIHSLASPQWPPSWAFHGMSWGGTAQSRVFCWPHDTVSRMDTHIQSLPGPMVLQVPIQRQVKTTGKDRKGGHGAPLRSLLRVHPVRKLGGGSSLSTTLFIVRSPPSDICTARAKLGAVLTSRLILVVIGHGVSAKVQYSTKQME